MGLYDSGGSSGGMYGARPASSRKKKKHKSYGILGDVGGFIGNLGRDLEEAAVGIPMGLVNLATHPLRTAELVGKSTWQDW